MFGEIQNFAVAKGTPSSSATLGQLMPERVAHALERRAVDAVFRSCPVVAIPGYARPLILVRDFLAWRESCTFRGDRVRPT